MKSGSFDLHTHSTYSDGTKTPFELIDMCKAEGMMGFSITDHDTVSAYSKQVFDYAEKIGVELISGVEFSTLYEKKDDSESIHILGYGIDVKNENLLSFCTLHKKRRHSRVKEILVKLNDAGFNLSIDEVFSLGKESVGRPHIALCLIEKGYAKDMKDAFKRFLGEKAPYFVKSEMPSIEDTITVIKNAGGKVVLAHPILIKGHKVLRKILDIYTFDGMECFYGNFKLSDIEYLIKMADNRNLLITGGSDYHGEHRVFVTMGSSFTTEDKVRMLLWTL